MSEVIPAKWPELHVSFPSGYKFLDMCEIALYVRDGMMQGKLSDGTTWRLEEVTADRRSKELAAQAQMERIIAANDDKEREALQQIRQDMKKSSIHMEKYGDGWKWSFTIGHTVHWYMTGHDGAGLYEWNGADKWVLVDGYADFELPKDKEAAKAIIIDLKV